ncbi:FG-GAP-like repeat-containing protein [Fulvivirga ligni]|uniref:FG-GAP-like repeat-containing protein n=1 Tax=Fulvivirga ligni TaxID=2904246 RepID=UPI001F39195C|nr:FG-GAP-like repeat-containing protein [Fulvivirga ligni]UII23800.1 FG-GAP-like repeat-containing protein [Fulvivirga ligni]
MHRYHQTFYSETLQKYRKFKGRLDKNLKSGRFYQFSKRKQFSLIKKVEQLYKRLKALGLQLKLGVAAGSLSLILSATAAQAQQLGPFVNNPLKNPLPPPVNTSLVNAPALFDFDDDGDFDLVDGDKYGNVHLFENIGTATEPRFNSVNDEDNPFKQVRVGGNASPAFFDLDGDGDMDLFVGNQAGNLIYFDNNNGSFTRDDDANPFAGQNFSSSYFSANIHPHFADADSDGDLDLLIGRSASYESGSSVLYFKNDNNVFEKELDAVSPFRNIQSYVFAAPMMTDIDDDGDMDLFIGKNNGDFELYINNNDEYTLEPNPWNPATKKGNPLLNVGIDEYNASPIFADLDDDGNLDVISGFTTYSGYSEAGPLFYIKNNGDFQMELKEGLANPVDGVDVMSYSNPELVDMDNDGDLDVFISGNKYNNQFANCKYYENTGDFKYAESDDFIEDLSFQIGFDAGRFKSFLVDYDKDGDQDIFTSYAYFSYDLMYFARSADSYENQTSTDNNPFKDVDQSFFLEDLNFTDIDSDGDLDVFISGYDGLLQFYINDNGVYNVKIDESDPLTSTSFGYDVNIAFADIDHDGDLDAFLGIKYGMVHMLQNIGTPTAPQFADPVTFMERSDDEVSKAPVFQDIDGDGDLDILVGSYSGQIKYYENQNEVPSITGLTDLNYNPTEDTAIEIASNLAITDTDDDLIISAVVRFTSGYDADEDILEFTNTDNITGSFNASTEELVFSGRAEISEYMDALQSLIYKNSNENAQATIKTLEVYATDYDNTDPTHNNAELTSWTITVGTEPPNSDINIYTAISPNGDGANDYWDIQNISLPNKVELYNRWGDLVYDAVDYDNDLTRFDGTSNKGKDLPSGIYFYKIKTSSGTYKGNVVLKRGL